jgi:hypothetical protein
MSDYKRRDLIRGKRFAPIQLASRLPGSGREGLAIRWWNESSQDGASASLTTLFSDRARVNRFFSMHAIRINNGSIARKLVSRAALNSHTSDQPRINRRSNVACGANNDGVHRKRSPALRKGPVIRHENVTLACLRAGQCICHKRHKRYKRKSHAGRALRRADKFDPVLA